MKKLRDLADFRLRSIRKLLELLLDRDTGPSNIWARCPMANKEKNVPNWFEDFQSRLIQVDNFTQAIPTFKNLFDKYLKALWCHIKATDCRFCMIAYVGRGEIFRTKLSDAWTQAGSVPYPMQGE